MRAHYISKNKLRARILNNFTKEKWSVLEGMDMPGFEH